MHHCGAPHRNAAANAVGRRTYRDGQHSDCSVHTNIDPSVQRDGRLPGRLRRSGTDPAGDRAGLHAES
jgi:hypothetical protein